MCRHHRDTLRAAGIHPVHDLRTQQARDRTYHVAAIVGARSLLHQARIRSALEILHDPTPEHISLPSIPKDYVSIFPEDDIPSADVPVDDVHANTPASSATIAPTYEHDTLAFVSPIASNKTNRSVGGEYTTDL